MKKADQTEVPYWQEVLISIEVSNFTFTAVQDC